MNRIFGTAKPKPTGPAPSLSDASTHIDGRVTHIEDQIKKCDEELAKFKPMLANPRAPGAASAKNRALVVLKRKRMYETQRDQLLGTQFNIDQAQFTTDQLKTTAVTVDAMKAASVSLKQQYKQMNIDDIEKVQDDMADLMMDQEEINDILGRSYAIPDGCDESALEAEFAMLSEEMGMQSATSAEAMPSYLPSDLSLPSVPSAPVGVPLRE